VAVVVAILIGVGVFAYYQVQQQELVSFLTKYGAYNSRFSYTPVAVIDVDSLPKPSGNLTFGTLIIAYAFHQPDSLDNIPYLWLTYVSGGCNSGDAGSVGGCREVLLIIPDNNVTYPGQEPPLYAHPLKSYGFELYTASGEHIEWHLYLFLVSGGGVNKETWSSGYLVDEFSSAKIQFLLLGNRAY
jgi:hypothetical protein